MNDMIETRKRIFLPFGDCNCRRKLLAWSVPRTFLSGASQEKRDMASSKNYFQKRERVLFAGGTAFGGTTWPAFKSKYYNLCTVVEAKNIRYALLSSRHHISRRPNSRRPNHSRRLLLHKKRDNLPFG